MPLPIESMPNLSKTVSRLSLLVAVVASQAYLIHAAFFAHALTPIGVFVIDPRTHLHRVSGQIGNIEEVFHWDGLTSTILIAILVFVVGWMAARGATMLRTSSGSPGPSIEDQQYQLAPAITASDLTAASTGGIE
jgi:hypothetical protein